jgi:ketosteroid isomerase-like protein
MARENVEIVRAAFDAWNRGDLDAWVDAFDDEAEFYPLRAQLEGRVYRGRDGARRFIAELDEDWEQARFEIEEVRDLGERGVGSGRFKARGRASRVELDVPLGWIGEVRDGKIVYARFYSDPAAALEAAEQLR